MDLERERRALKLFEEALEKPVPEREAWLVAQAGEDAALRDALLAMLASGGSSSALPTMPPDPIDQPEDVPPPERIGPYQLTGELGRGGMGVVWRGERIDGLFDQKVAIKLMRGHLLNERMRELFASERRILAGLQHPHIARLYDGGTTDLGQSYFVMELIDGDPIGQHCAAQGLNLRDRVRLILPLCDAVHYAHQQLVVHADIKPGSILIDPVHGPKLLDFGISRLSGVIEEGTSTKSGMSPRYASPQVKNGAKAMPADDIYALGVLLADLSEGLVVDHELAAVIERARAEEPEGRYDSALALRDDLRRWLGGYPVQAVAPSRKRTLGHFVRRNRVMVAIASSAALFIVGASGYAINRSIAANKRYAETQAMTRYLLGDVVAQSRPLPGSGDMRLGIAQRALSALQRLGDLGTAREELRLEFADAYLVIGEIMTSPDAESVENSAAQALRAVTKARSLYATGFADERRAQHAREQDMRANVVEARLRGLANSEEGVALTLLDKVEPQLEDWIKASPSSVNALLLRAETDVLRASIKGMTNDFPGAIVASTDAIGQLDRLRPSTDDERVRATLLRDQAWAEIGDARWYGNDDKKGAATAYRAALAAHEVPGLPTDARLSKRKAHAVFNLSSTIYELGQSAEASRLMQTALREISDYRKFDSSSAVRQQENTLTMEYANQLEASGQPTEAASWFSRSIAGRRAVASSERGNYNAVRSLPVGLRVLGLFEIKTGKKARGCARLKEAQTLWRQLDEKGRLASFDRTDAAAQTNDALKQCS